jgi:ribosomal protein S21
MISNRIDDLMERDKGSSHASHRVDQALRDLPRHHLSQLSLDDLRDNREYTDTITEKRIHSRSSAKVSLLKGTMKERQE